MKIQKKVKKKGKVQDLYMKRIFSKFEKENREMTANSLVVSYMD